jgi:hypothetical protein
LGTVPENEECPDPRRREHRRLAPVLCRVYIRMLRRWFGPEPASVWYCTRRVYYRPYRRYLYEVYCSGDRDKPKAMAYVANCREMAPNYWDAQALRELLHHERTKRYGSRK